MLKVAFNQDFQRKLLVQSFAAGSELRNVADVDSWREQWLEQLAAWHTPYKSLINCQNLRVADTGTLQVALTEMHSLLQKFFLRKAACCNASSEHQVLPFQQFTTEQEAYEFLGIRQPRAVGANSDLRGQVIVQNHFQQQVVELGFSQDFCLDSEEKYLILKSKLANNLAQWHTHWSLLIDCSHFTVSSSYCDKFDALIDFLRRYFLQKVVGYNGKQADFSFKVFRSKHRAALALESADIDKSGDEAHCRRSISQIGGE